MKKNIIFGGVWALSFVATWTGISPVPFQTPDMFPRCCVDDPPIGPPAGAKCTDMKSKISCYNACAGWCGETDSLGQKKCRIACDIRFPSHQGAKPS